MKLVDGRMEFIEGDLTAVDPLCSQGGYRFWHSVVSTSLNPVKSVARCNDVMEQPGPGSWGSDIL